jgi:hypothetical protein
MQQYLDQSQKPKPVLLWLISQNLKAINKLNQTAQCSLLMISLWERVKGPKLVTSIAVGNSWTE